MKLGAIRLLLSIACQLGVVIDVAQAQAPVLASDLALMFECKQPADERMEALMERFLGERAFNTLNLSRLGREHGGYSRTLNVLGLDEKQRIVNITDLSTVGAGMVLTLTTPPPTQRATTLKS